jgi:hypothetical protein
VALLVDEAHAFADMLDLGDPVLPSEHRQLDAVSDEQTLAHGLGQLGEDLEGEACGRDPIQVLRTTDEVP